MMNNSTSTGFLCPITGEPLSVSEIENPLYHPETGAELQTAEEVEAARQWYQPHRRDLYVVCHITSEMVSDADDVPYVNRGVCRSWSASDEDNPIPDLRLFVVFNREPRDFEEAISTTKACLNP